MSQCLLEVHKHKLVVEFSDSCCVIFGILGFSWTSNTHCTEISSLSHERTALTIYSIDAIDLFGPEKKELDGQRSETSNLKGNSKTPGSTSSSPNSWIVYLMFVKSNCSLNSSS